MNSAFATLESERDIVIKSAATLDAGGKIQVGANHDGNVDVYGTLRLPGLDTDTPGSLGIFGNLMLESTSTTRIRVRNNLADYITATGTITLGGTLQIVDPNAADDQTWTIFKAGTELPANSLFKLIGDFASITDGFTTSKDANTPPSELKLKKGNG